jgi:hypothetical protein
LEGGIRNKAARGELRKAVPVGFVWGEDDGEILLDGDEAIRGAIQTIFDRFAELGSVRQVWLWMRRESVQFPGRRYAYGGEIKWAIPTYHQIHSVLESPVYAGAYAFGKTRRERYVDEHGNTRQRIRRLPQAEWGVLIWDHHPGFIDKPTFEANRERIAGNTRPRAHEPGGAVREGGRAAAGHRGVRPLRAQAQGPLSRPPRAPKPRLSLPREHPGRRTRQLVPAGRRRSDRPSRRRRAPGRAHTRWRCTRPKRSSTTTTPR